LIAGDLGSGLGFISPLVAPAGAFVIGGLVGWGLKKIVKIAATILGIMFVAILVLQYKGYLSVVWQKFYNDAQELITRYHLTAMDGTNPLAHIVAVAGVPSAGTFLVGAAIGFKKG
jgi:uncharacterized membrane protein (Fun14 family)